MQARDVMVSPMVTVGPTATVCQVANAAGASDRRCTGRRHRRTIKVQDVMTQEVTTAVPKTLLHEIAMLLEEHQIKRVPIINKEGQLVGIVSRANLLQAIAGARPKLEISVPDSVIRKKFLEGLESSPWLIRLM
jgi:signal-transduction protein with cAMP-binding, CBS, and nucleotidyltransferase domain